MGDISGGDDALLPGTAVALCLGAHATAIARGGGLESVGFGGLRGSGVAVPW